MPHFRRQVRTPSGPYRRLRIFTEKGVEGVNSLEVRQNQVSSRSFYTQVIPGRGAWPDLPGELKLQYTGTEIPTGGANTGFYVGRYYFSDPWLECRLKRVLSLQMKLNPSFEVSKGIQSTV